MNDTVKADLFKHQRETAMNEDGYPVKVKKMFAHQKKAADEMCRVFFGEEGIPDDNKVRSMR